MGGNGLWPSVFLTVQQEITQLGFKLFNMPFSLWDHRVNYPKAQCSLEARDTISKPNSRPIMIHYTVSHCKLMQLLSFILRQTSCGGKNKWFYLSVGGEKIHNKVRFENSSTSNLYSKKHVSWIPTVLTGMQLVLYRWAIYPHAVVSDKLFRVAPPRLSLLFLEFVWRAESGNLTRGEWDRHFIFFCLLC